jgi:ubiquinone/menaquinone biosynthesis C-methylase UbiE
LLGNRQIQHEVLDALATCRHHRTWFAEFARPYLGRDPIEVGSGLGDYALEWLPDVDSFTATEADPAMLERLELATAGLPNLKVRQLALPTAERSDHSCVIGYNVLEHIADDVAALRSMARLVRPGGHVVLVCPAFEFAMSRVDIATGHVRRYSRATMRQALTAAGLDIFSVRYANSLGLLCYYGCTSLLGKAPTAGPMMTCYDWVAVPVIRAAERLVSPPFGQSVVAVARRPW